MKKEIKIDVCSLCVGLWMTLEGECPCKTKEDSGMSSCLLSSSSLLEEGYQDFDNYIEEQVQMVKEMMKMQDVMPGEKMKIKFEVECEGKCQGLKN